MHIAEVGMSVRGAAAGGAEQVPGHIENARTGRPQEHLQYRASVHLPMVGKRIGPDPLDGQVIRPTQKIFKMLQKGAICALTDNCFTQGLEARPASRAESA